MSKSTNSPCNMCCFTFARTGGCCTAGGMPPVTGEPSSSACSSGSCPLVRLWGEHGDGTEKLSTAALAGVVGHRACSRRTSIPCRLLSTSSCEAEGECLRDQG